MSKAIDGELVVATPRGNIVPVQSALEIRAAKNAVKSILDGIMQSDVHYGIIPGTKKPSLYKAGSETILSAFGIAVMPEVDDLSTADCARYRVRCRGVLRDRSIIGVGLGEASTDEEKYKWRQAVCTEEYDNTAEDRRRIKYSTAYGNRDKIIQTKQVRTNHADLANTVLKMAKKRAQIDLTLTATGASDIFTQDVEDLPEGYDVGHEDGKPLVGKPDVKDPAKKTEKEKKQTTGDPDMATEGQVKLLSVKLKQANISADDFCKNFAIDSLENLPRNRVNEALKHISGK